MDILCLDIGGTSTRAAIVGESGIQNKLVRKTPFSNKDEMLNQTINLVKDFCNLNSVNAISIGCAGPVYNSIMQGSEPMGISDNINFKKIINEHFNIPTYVENDLQMAIRAERKYGFGRGIKNFVVISLSTGIGVAVIKNNIILEGRIEIGHNIIDINKNYQPSFNVIDSKKSISFRQTFQIVGRINPKLTATLKGSYNFQKSNRDNYYPLNTTRGRNTNGQASQAFLENSKSYAEINFRYRNKFQNHRLLSLFKNDIGPLIFL